jgi:phosphoenolpyruvate carboxykinase (ATP)
MPLTTSLQISDSTNSPFTVKVYYQLSEDSLIDYAIKHEGAELADNGALSVRTGVFTGRSPKDRFIVLDDITKNEVWWGEINKSFKTADFNKLYKKMILHIESKTLFARDVYACADPRYKTSIRVLTENAWSNLFVRNMFIQPNKEELKLFSHEWLVVNAPSFKADPIEDHTRQKNFTIINFTQKVILIGGSGYTGEIKKSIFSVLNFTLPTQHSVLPMHCSANSGKKGDSALFFGLSGTGKTTLSADPTRALIGDDEHGWTPDNKVFNFEGGCYAKVIKLSADKEPDIHAAIKKGALLENVVMDTNGKVDYFDDSITQNTRVSYPLHHIKNIKTPSIGDHTRHVFFLTADAFGVLPPISKLTPEQAAYHFISGYTAKVAGTEEGVVEPVPSFSACFGAPFMPLHPVRYADMLAEKMKINDVDVWLINTGWTGGPYGKGHRIALPYTRAMIQAALSGALGPYEYKTYHIHSVFGVAQPRSCPGVPQSVLSPRQTWNDDEAYYKQAYKLAKTFRENFKTFEAIASEEILSAAPKTS